MTLYANCDDNISVVRTYSRTYVRTYIGRKMLIADIVCIATVFDFVLLALLACFPISKSGQRANEVENGNGFSQKNVQICFMQLMMIEIIFCIY